MFGGVLVLRRIATTDMAARATQTQMHPPVADGETFFEALRARLIGLDGAQMAALSRHDQRL